MRLARARFAVSVALALAAAPPAVAQRAPLSRQARLQLADSISHALRAEELDAWYPRAVDRRDGGFLSRLDYEWKPVGPQDKMIVTQARHVWTTAQASLFFPDDTTYLPEAAHGFAFLRDEMWDARDGGFYWLVARDGTPKREPDGRIVKQAYGEAFGIYGLAGYYEASHDTAALHLAQRAFRWLDRHAHDPVHGGYFNYLLRDGTPLTKGYDDTPPKDQNSSIHILEALTSLYRVWPDPTVRARLAEMLHLVRDTMRTDPGYLRLFFTADWTPISYRDSTEAVRKAHDYFDHVSYGHDVETAYLMLEASHALGLKHDTTTPRLAKQMVDHALRTGWDDGVGGFYDEGYYFRDRPGVTIIADTKNWWAQAEGLNTLLLMGDLFPSDPMHYQQRFLKQWSYIDRYLIDHQHGGWYEGGLDKEPQRKTGDKGHIWKAAYHDSRAMMNVVRRLRNPPPPAGATE
ncbi:MAG TPA: AGE family epimerase/isomerase [Longimicrobiaceae bacterium]|nr:AGE family epimerase/isomerase [Longimicrobiaceae bacterium]